MDFPAYFRAGVFGTASWRIPCGLIPPNPWGPLRTGRPGAGPPSFGGVPDSGSGFPCFREGFRNELGCRFVSRCGARDTGFTEHLFDAWFRILVLDCPGAGTFADRQAVDALVDCYRRTISETEWQKYVQFYCPDGTKYC